MMVIVETWYCLTVQYKQFNENLKNSIIFAYYEFLFLEHICMLKIYLRVLFLNV